MLALPYLLVISVAGLVFGAWNTLTEAASGSRRRIRAAAQT
jgi:hypothetical protein